MPPPTCQSCDAPLRWVKSTTGKWMPLDRDPTPDGAIVLEENLLGETIGRIVGPATGTHQTHFATCPNANHHRRPRGRRRRRRAGI